MNDKVTQLPPAAIDSTFDTTRPLFADGPPDPVVHDGSPRAIRQRTVNFAAKRFADMMYVSGLDRSMAERHFRWRALGIPGGLTERPDASAEQAGLIAAHRAGRIVVETNDADRRATVRWTDAEFGAPLIGSAIARADYGGILLGSRTGPAFDPAPIQRKAPGAGRAWPRGDAVEPPGAPPAELTAALDALFANSSGIYGILIASPDRVLAERHSAFGAPDRATPSWSMTKAVTCTLIGRLIHEGWLGSVYDPAPAPLWRDPRCIHHLITIDHLLRMRSGLAFPVVDADGRATIGFENSAVYQDAADAFDAAQRSIVATVPGSVYRYINAGLNVLGAIIRDRIESRGLPYHQTVYELLADRLGMSTYQHSADCVGNLIASGSGFATLRDYAKLGVLYVQDGVWDGDRLLPRGWADYALAPTHAGSSYAACFRSNADRSFPNLPADAAWASGASDQRIFILRRQRLVVAVNNETDHPMDLAALNRVIATAIATRWR
jgi:CubicO group peptidase (beta-lactamase class C family)